MFFTRTWFISFSFILFTFISACKGKHPPDSYRDEKQIVEKPAEMDAKVNENIKDVLQYAIDNKGKINDVIRLNAALTVDSFYKKDNYENIWSKDEHWEPLADSLFNFITASEQYGLFPSDYHFNDLHQLRDKLVQDSTAKADANIWTKAELMLTDAFIQISKHLKQGRLLPDSISLAADTSLTSEFFVKNLNTVIENKEITSFFTSLEPKLHGYIDLRACIKKFTETMDRKRYTYVIYPYKDSLAFIKNLFIRLKEGKYLDPANKLPDSIQIANAIKKFQKAKGIKAEGKISPDIIKKLNSSDVERFKKIAINLDRYKQLPASLPEKYIWVNLPGYYLKLFDNDTMVFESRTIVGKPTTRTPTLNSEITNMVTYPNWTIPNSIIKKDILPAMKKDPGYLARKGFNLVDLKGETVDPYSVNWQKYTKGIPYKIVQGSGDDNALGILKFNFNNPYSVYLHDTNQRYLFKNTSRALSHGCVRVQEWQKLAFYIATNDSLNQKPGTTLNYNIDSIKTWLDNKVRKVIIIKQHLPLFIRYFTCEGKNGKIIFYDDIYSEDKTLREKYFANK